MRQEYFYRIETTVDGISFATARGWEDLSQLLNAYELLGRRADREVVYQYIQHWKIAKDFANYLELFEKYKKDYGLEKILDGQYTKETTGLLGYASFDERLSVIGMIIGSLSDVMTDAREAYESGHVSQQMTRFEDRVFREVLNRLEEYQQLIKREHLSGNASLERIRQEFQKENRQG